jgi:flavin-dependent thymidylate synthase
MKVTVVDYTGAGLDDRWYAAKKLIRAKNTRVHTPMDMDSLSQEELLDQLKAVAMTIRSSWEFVNITFKIEDISRACCDQMTRSRVGVSFAVMAQRVVDNSHFKYVMPDSIKKNKKLLEVFEMHMVSTAFLYSVFIKEGIPAQDARSILPMATYSPLTAEYNLRSLAGVVAKRENLRAQGEYASVAAEMKRLTIQLWPWADMFLSPEGTRTPAIDKIMKDALGDRSPVEKPELNDALKELDLLKKTWD